MTKLGQMLDIPNESVAAFCRRNHIRRLSLFGSHLHGNAGAEGDIDLIVEFAAGFKPGLLGLARLEGELSEMLGGKRVDLRTPDELSRYFRAEVLAEAEVQYAER